MHRYNRAYKDGNSPLTPLTPLPSNSFDFNIDTEEPSCSRLARSGSVRNSAIPRTRQRVASFAANTRTCTPQSCESALKKRNNYVKVIAALGSELIGRPVPPARIKRTNIKQEPVCTVPVITLQPPPRTKKRKVERSNTNIKSEASYHSSEYVGAENSQLMPLAPPQQRGRHFDLTKIRLSSPVTPKPMSPRFGAFLARWGINCLKSIFERQEIDLQTFCCLTADDLELLGIPDPESRERVMAAINFVTSIGMNWASE